MQTFKPKHFYPISKFLVFVIAIAILLLSCNKSNKLDDAPISSEWLLPLIKADIAALQLTTLKNRTFHYEISPTDCGLTEGTPTDINSPMDVYNLGPFKIATNDLIHSAQLDQCEFELTITNNFPVPIKKGSRFSIKTNGVATPLLTFLIEQDLSEGGQVTQTFNLSGKEIFNSLYIYLDTLHVGTGQNVTFNENISFDFNIKKLSVNSVELLADKHFDILDTMDFDGSSINFDEFDNKITDSMVKATLYLNGKNDFPFELGFQIYFLSETQQTIDSLFKPISEIESAIYNGGQFSQTTTSQFTTTLTKERLTKIKGATQAVYSIKLNTENQSAPTLFVDNSQMLKLRLVGDIRLILNSNIFENFF